MKNRIMRWHQLTLVCFIVGISSNIISAQTILWGTASSNATFPNGRIMRIDYDAGSIQATFNGPVGFVIGDGFSGVGVRPSNGQVFIADGFGTNRIFRVDPNTGVVLSSFPSPTGVATLDGLEFVNDELYAHQITQSAIIRINPDTGAQLGVLPGTFSSGVQGGLTLVNNFLYTHGSANNVTIARRDLATGNLVNQFATPNNEVVLGLASDGTSLFAASNAGFIYRLDPTTGAVLDSRNFGINFDGLGGTIVASVPEPGTMVLCGLGLGAAVAVGAKRFKRRSQKRIKQEAEIKKSRAV